MGKGNFTDDFKLNAIRQITERGHSVADTSCRLGVSTHSLYSWLKRYNGSFRKQQRIISIPKLQSADTSPPAKLLNGLCHLNLPTDKMKPKSSINQIFKLVT